MQYELQFFHQLIHQDFKIKSFKECVKFLQSKYEQPLLISQARIIEENGELQLAEVNDYYFLAAEKLQQITANIFDEESKPEIENFITKDFDTRVKSIRYNQISESQLEVIIEQDLSYQNLSREEIIYHYYDLKNNDEYDKILYNFQRTVFNSKDESEISLYIKNHQYDIQKLLMLLLHKLLPEEKRAVYKISNNFNYKDLIKNTYHYLEKIALYLHDSFSKYTDNKVAAPFYLLSSKAIIWKNRLKDITSLLESKINESLLQIVQEMIIEIEGLTIESSFSYADIEYFDRLIINFSRFINEPIEEEKLIRFLIRQNYNSVPLIEYITEKISNLLADEVSVERKLKILYQYRKSYGQIQAESMGYRAGTSLQNTLLDWLEEEIDFLQKLHQLEHLVSKETLEEKLETQMSVLELSYFVKIQRDIGLIRNKNLTFISEKFTRHINTKRQDNPTSKSFRKKLYNAEHSTMTSVREWLIKLLKRVDKDLGYGETNYDR